MEASKASVEASTFFQFFSENMTMTTNAKTLIVGHPLIESESATSGVTMSIPYKYIVNPSQTARESTVSQSEAVRWWLGKLPTLRFSSGTGGNVAEDERALRDAEEKLAFALDHDQTVFFDIDSAGVASIHELDTESAADLVRRHKERLERGAGSDWLDLDDAAFLAFHVERG